jgi:hypothetical protein
MKRTHTRCGGDEIGKAAADDTDRSGTRERGSRDMCDDVEDELRAVRLEAGAPESLLEEEEEGAAAAGWKRI